VRESVLAGACVEFTSSCCLLWHFGPSLQKKVPYSRAACV